MLDKKRILIVGIAITVIGVGILISYSLIKRKSTSTNKEIKEYIPQEEITQEELRKTMVSLYFKNENTLIPEARLIDVKELLNDPYEKILNMLIEGPKNEKLESTIPDGTKVNKVERNGETLTIDFSEEFVKNHKGGEEEEKLTIRAIVKTMTELTEINQIKIIINGEENKEFQDKFIKFNINFTKEF